ncbi:hypothetical protein V5O48_008208 [Marasmius crinis-equi]|uniref:Uncharacterized protein n=1 Tax=Marasmius crinis-equi TaxID=585013 RepID=A0ABR3FEW5_9AGAR
MDALNVENNQDKTTRTMQSAPRHDSLMVNRTIWNWHADLSSSLRHAITEKRQCEQQLKEQSAENHQPTPTQQDEGPGQADSGLNAHLDAGKSM